MERKLSIPDDDEEVPREKKNRPSPADFENFLPWACCQLSVSIIPNIIRVEQNEYTPRTASDRTKKGKGQKAKEEDVDADSTESKSFRGIVSSFQKDDLIVNMQAVYDNNDRLVQLKFVKNRILSRIILKIISLIGQFHPRLTSISADSGLTSGAIYELSKVIAHSKVTEITLDNSRLEEANYHTLLENNSPLKYLSLARCFINDAVIKNIAAKLACPLSASRTLSVLILTSNRITDVGAKYIGDALRYNRQLSYLNLADNMITDLGADSILSSLTEFKLTSTEIIEKKARNMAYLKERNAMLARMVKNMQPGEYDKKGKRKTLKPVASASAKKNKTPDIPEYVDRSVQAIDASNDKDLVERAEAALGPYNDPYKPENTIYKDGQLYCLGNNTLCYLSLAYNNLTYFSVKKLYTVLAKQESLNRKPRGLVNVCIEGNNLPETCAEMVDIDNIIGNGFSSYTRKPSYSTKKKVDKAVGSKSQRL